MYTILDVETSGFISPNYPPTHPRQGRVLQIGALLLDENFKEKSSFCYYIDIDAELIIHPNAFASHNITIEKCKKFGVPVEIPIMALDVYLKKSKGCVGHNLAFDMRHVAFEDVATFGNITEKARLDFKTQYCTMKLANKVHKMGNSSLEKVYEYFFLKKPDVTHDALADCRSCAAIFEKLCKEHNILIPENIISIAQK